MLFKNANIFVDGRFQHGAFRVENGRFTEVLNTVPAEDGIDLENQYVIPGLVDVHNHGNSGADFSDGDYDGLVKMARYLAQNGVTSFAPASMTLPYDVLEAAYKTAVQLKNAQPSGCARIVGIQMEGPFFSEKKKGAQNGAYLREPPEVRRKKRRQYFRFHVGILYHRCHEMWRIRRLASIDPSRKEAATRRFTCGSSRSRSGGLARRGGSSGRSGPSSMSAGRARRHRGTLSCRNDPSIASPVSARPRRETRSVRPGPSSPCGQCAPAHPGT